jgi:sigma-B regulation protein RsbU (phosphoserine phosphatase)
MNESTPSSSQSIRHLDSLLEVSKALGAEVRLDSLLGVILKQATEVMEAERSSIFIFEPESQTLAIRVSEDIAAGQIRTPLGVGIAGHVAQTQELLNIPDAYADPRFNPQSDRDIHFRTRSILCAPMLTHAGRLIGVVQLLNKVGSGAFTADDERLFSAFASLAGIALDRAQLVEAYLEKQKIEASLRLAHDIQMSMLPKRFPERPEFELDAVLRPARAVGGDLYDFRVDGHHLWFLVGDVSGKGVGPALFMAVTKALFGASIGHSSSPSTVMAKVNAELHRDNEQGLFVTLFLGRLDIATGELLYANAGHSSPYRLHGNGGVSALPGEPGMVLGVRGDYPYQTERVRLDAGDGLYACTDGVTDALGPDGEEFSAARLEKYLATAASRKADDLVQGTLRVLAEFVGPTPQFDDTTILCLRYLAG